MSKETETAIEAAAGMTFNDLRTLSVKFDVLSTSRVIGMYACRSAKQIAEDSQKLFKKHVGTPMKVSQTLMKDRIDELKVEAAKKFNNQTEIDNETNRLYMLDKICSEIRKSDQKLLEGTVKFTFEPIVVKDNVIEGKNDKDELIDLEKSFQEHRSVSFMEEQGQADPYAVFVEFIVKGYIVSESEYAKMKVKSITPNI